MSHQLSRSSHQMKKFQIEHEHKILSKKEDKNQSKRKQNNLQQNKMVESQSRVCLVESKSDENL